MSNEDILDRIQLRLRELDLSPRAASLRAGKGADLIRNMMRSLARGKDYSPRAETINVLSKVLDTSASWLLSGDIDDKIMHEHERPVRREYSDFVLASYGGFIESGAYRSLADDRVDGRPFYTLHRDASFPDAGYIMYDVNDDTMQDLRPRPIYKGDRIFCIDLRKVSRFKITHGMIIVLERRILDGSLLERSLGQAEVTGDGDVKLLSRSKGSTSSPISLSSGSKKPFEQKVEPVGLVRSVLGAIPPQGPGGQIAV